VTATRVRPFSLQLVAWRGNHPSSTPQAQVTLAWLIALSGDQIARLDDLAPATGDRHDETNMSVIER
jgi:hypothetical protein